MMDTILQVAMLPMQIPIPDLNPEAPPGMGKMGTILNWIGWAVAILCFAAFLIGIGVLVIGGHSPEEKGGKKIIVALIGLVLLGSAGAIMGALV